MLIFKLTAPKDGHFTPRQPDGFEHEASATIGGANTNPAPLAFTSTSEPHNHSPCSQISLSSFPFTSPTASDQLSLASTHPPAAATRSLRTSPDAPRRQALPVFQVMDALPLELRERICSYLFPPIDRINAVSAPTSSEVERTAIYSLRLTSQRMKDATSFVFLKVIQDIPRQCTETSLYNLWNLIHLTGNGSQITALTFTSCKLNFSERTTWSQVFELVDEQCEFIEHSLARYLCFIFAITPRLRHLVCCFEWVRGFKVAELGYDSFETLSRIVAEKVPDPIHHVFRALEHLRLHKKIETLGIFITSRNWYHDGTDPLSVRREYFPLPSLKHMTLSAAYHNYSRVLIYCGKATSLKIILEYYCGTCDFIPTHLRTGELWSTRRVDMGNHHLSDDEAAAIQCRREYTITGNGRYVTSYILMDLIQRLFEHESTVPSLTICDMNIVQAIGSEGSPFEIDKKISRLVFLDVVHCEVDDKKFDFSMPLDEKCSAFAFIRQSALEWDVSCNSMMNKLGTYAPSNGLT
ncbi:hypothetical protein IQ07DRAFT_603554 [Pyrenochaeta sp. DS3sAY3a]|nr:hypothetical protein IQ07DRAFT_603554 [Pyrenochaeta sp. DS3sAY3a]